VVYFRYTNQAVKIYFGKAFKKRPFEYLDAVLEKLLPVDL